MARQFRARRGASIACNSAEFALRLSSWRFHERHHRSTFSTAKALENIMGRSEFLSISPERQFEPSARSLVLYGAPRRTRNDLGPVLN
jgi:hypothetical protein